MRLDAREDGGGEPVMRMQEIASRFLFPSFLSFLPSLPSLSNLFHGQKLGWETTLRLFHKKEQREREKLHDRIPLFRRELFDTRTLALVSSKFVATGLNRGIRVLKRKSRGCEFRTVNNAWPLAAHRLI